jgi:hypothetical protein
MLGPAELREIHEAQSRQSPEQPRTERRSPYITPSFAASVAVARAMVNGFKRLTPVTGEP